MNRTYKIIKQGASIGIKCLRCGLTSWLADDVQRKYCGNCHKFHEDIYGNPIY